MSRARELAKVGGKNQQIISGLSSHVGVSTFKDNVFMYSNLEVTGTTAFNGGTLTLGDGASDNVVFGADVNSHIIPNTDATYDLGSSTQEWRNLYIDGTANIDALVADTADINGGTVDGAAIGGNSASTGQFTTVAASSNATITGNLDVDGDTTLDTTDVAGTLTVVGTAVVDNVIINGNIVATNSGDLTLNSTSGTTNVDDALNVTGGTTTTALNANGDVNLGDATSDTITCTGRFDAALVPASDNAIDLGTSTLEYKDLYLDGTANIDSLVADTADINGGTIDGTVIGGSTRAAGSFTTILASGNVDFNASIDVDGTTNLDTTNVDGTLTVTGQANVDNVIINGSTITTSADNLTLDSDGSSGGTVAIADNATVAGNLTVTGNTVLNGTIDLGDATSDTITPTARFDAALVPASDGAIDLGTSTLEYRDLYIDGTANIDSLVADTADINGGTVDGATIGANSASTGAFTTISASGNVDFNGDLDVDGTTNLDAVDIDGAVDMASNLVIAGNIDANGNLDVDGTTDLDNTNVAGTFSVTGFTNLDNVTVNASTVSTSSGDLVLNSTGGTVQVYDNLAVQSGLDVDGATTLDGLTVAENATFSAAIDVDGHTNLDNVSVAGVSTFTGATTFTGAIDANGGATVDNIQIGVTNDNEIDTSSGNLVIDSAGGTTTVDDNLTVSGNLTVNGTTTTINSTTVAIDDKNFQVATGAADDAAADGGGLTVDSGDGDKTWNFEATGDNWGSSENINIASGKSYKINNSAILNATTLGSSVVASSLTSVGTIASGVWNGTAITNANLANSSVAYGGVTLSLGGSDATPAFDLSDATNYPTSSLSGTITNAQLAGSIANSKLSTISTANKVSISALNIDGGTDIGAALANTDEIIVDDGGGGTNRRCDMSRVKTYIYGAMSGDATAGSGGAVTLAASGVSAATYGSSTAIPIVTIDAKGRVTSATTTAVDSTTIENGTASVAVTEDGPITSTGNHDFTAGIDVTGNITVTGTVDGRDVASDGSKLDGIEASATADQSAAEIRTLVESASDSNVFTDADHSKLNGIESAATADQTAAEIRALVESASDSNVFTDADHSKLNGIEASATADQTASEILTLIKTVDGAGSGLDADKLDNISSGSFLRSDTGDTFSGDLTSSGGARILLQKTDNNVSDHIIFYNGSTRIGEIGCEDGTWLRINQETAKNIYTPRYIRADAGFFVDGTSKGINGSGNYIGGTIAGASDYNTLLRSNTSDTMSGTLTMAGNIIPDSNGGRSLGLTGTRWGNVYTSDIDLSNEARGGNQVDGSWGSYLIEEGENDLFLKNRRTGKQYKFVLQEV